MNVRDAVEARVSLCRCVSETDETAFVKVLTDLLILLTCPVLVNRNIWAKRKLNPRGFVYKNLELYVDMFV